jgi:TIR domain
MANNTIKNQENPKIYFSYAWGDAREEGESREKIVQQLYDSLKADGYNLKRDKEELGYTQSINAFMNEIGQSDFIVVAISDKYLKSSYCMYEMLKIYRQSDSDIIELRKKIYPIVLGDAKIHDPMDMLDYVLYWQDKKKRLEEKINLVGFDAASAVVPDFKNYKEIMDNVGLISAMLRDMNTLNPSMLSKDNFEEIKKVIIDRGGRREALPPLPQSPVLPPSITKDEILALIDKDLDSSFDKLDSIFGEKNIYNDLSKEYVSQPNNFSIASFRSRLKRFVNQNWK